MKSYAIVIKDHPISEHGFSNLLDSSEKVKNDFEIERFDAYTPETAYSWMAKNRYFSWNWPLEGSAFDFALGLKKTAYQTANQMARIACFLSHYELWKKCIDLNESILILEHDAYFINKLPIDKIKLTNGTISINDPRGATRKASLYHALLKQVDRPGFNVVPAPWIDEDRSIIQGLPGNSAYIVTPQFARNLINIIDQVGMWPNDALICKQLFPNRLWCTTKYYTVVQGLMSTTTR
jgi:GR25 family glycosyltransferase involved in LPS biosynthesis